MDISEEDGRKLLTNLYQRHDRLEQEIERENQELGEIESLLPILNPCPTCKGNGINPNYVEADRLDPNKSMTCPDCHGKKTGLRNISLYPKV